MESIFSNSDMNNKEQLHRNMDSNTFWNVFLCHYLDGFHFGFHVTLSCPLSENYHVITHINLVNVIERCHVGFKGNQGKLIKSELDSLVRELTQANAIISNLIACYWLREQCFQNRLHILNFRVGWMEFYVLATSKVISGEVPTCEKCTHGELIVLSCWKIRPPAP